jgi:hypothetical protein
VAYGRATEERSASAGERPTRRSSEREPADSLRDKSNVTGGWLSSLTSSFGFIERFASALCKYIPPIPWQRAASVFVPIDFLSPLGAFRVLIG